MFRIGEFAQIAQVSPRQLRHYDQLGLFQPGHTHRQSGYRYYSIRQLPRLNRLLALKELGLTLDQIGPLLDDRVSPDELRGMLTMKRAQVAQSLQAEEDRLRHIETRISQIDRDGSIDGYDVIRKSVGATPFLSTRHRFGAMDAVVQALCTLAELGARQLRPALRDKLIVVSGNDDDSATLDLQLGFSLHKTSNLGLNHPDLGTFEMAELPASDMATIVRAGTNAASHSAFATIGTWIEAQNLLIAGPCREVFLEPFTGPSGFAAALVEIQFPVRPAA
jgi:DNA-binding transcriptional MerR regulator